MAPYSSLTALAGSMRIARIAGTMHASEGDDHQCRCGSADDERIRRAYAEQKRHEQLRDGDRCNESEQQADECSGETAAQDQTEDVAAGGAERHADADLARPFRDRLREHAVESHRREQDGGDRKDPEQPRRRSAHEHGGGRIGDLLDRPHAEDRRSMDRARRAPLSLPREATTAATVRTISVASLSPSWRAGKYTTGSNGRSMSSNCSLPTIPTISKGPFANSNVMC